MMTPIRAIYNFSSNSILFRMFDKKCMEYTVDMSHTCGQGFSP